MIGTSLGHFEITAKLGEGGMGEVWRATDLRLKREVALKVLPAALASDPERLRRFEREAQLLAQLHHPLIASIFGLEEGDGRLALIMELVEGVTLAEQLHLGAIPPDQILTIARQIAEAVEAAHEKGIVHRDLKPQNIKLTPEGAVKVLDFGLAKALTPDPGSAAAADATRSPTLTMGATVQGVILGTAAYMSPEQARGQPTDKRTDIWAFGVILWEMLTGHRLFAGESIVDVLGAVVGGPIDLDSLPPTVPRPLRELLRRSLERNPRNRLRDIGDARIALTELIEGSDEIHADSTPAVPPTAHSFARRWLVPTGIALGGAALGLLVGWRLLNHREDATAKPAFRTQKLTFLPGVEWAPELSADGKTLFFVAGDTTRSEIYSVPVGGKKPTSLTAGVDAFHDQPKLSPDGNHLVFASTRDGGGLFLMGVNGESVRKLADRGADPAWSPDGRYVAFATLDFLLPYEGLDGGGLGVIDVAAGTTRELPTEDGYQPAWSPSGRRIAFWSVRGGDRELATIAVEGGEPVTVASHPAVDWNPVWSEDGRHLYFLSDRGGTMNLWRVGIDEATGMARDEPENVPLPADEVIYLARAGAKWIYAAYSSRSSIQIVELDPERAALVGTPRSLLATSRSLREVAVSPDGRQIAFTTMRPQEDVYVVPTAGGTPTQLTDDPEFDRYVSWTPDGERIVFSSFRGVKYEHYWIRPDGSGFQALTEIPPQGLGWYPLFSPRADRMLVSTASGVAILDTSGPPPWSRFERTAPPDGPPGTNFSGAMWSPEGDRLAGFVYRGREPRRAAVLDLTTGSYRIFEPTSRSIGWFPDGRRVLILWQSRLAVLDLATWRATPVPGSPELQGRVTASRDLRTIVSLADDSQADIWLAEELPPGS